MWRNENERPGAFGIRAVHARHLAGSAAQCPAKCRSGSGLRSCWIGPRDSQQGVWQVPIRLPRSCQTRRAVPCRFCTNERGFVCPSLCPTSATPTSLTTPPATSASKQAVGRASHDPVGFTKEPVRVGLEPRRVCEGLLRPWKYHPILFLGSVHEKCTIACTVCSANLFSHQQMLVCFWLPSQQTQPSSPMFAYSELNG